MLSSPGASLDTDTTTTTPSGVSELWSVLQSDRWVVERLHVGIPQGCGLGLGAEGGQVCWEVCREGRSGTGRIGGRQARQTGRGQTVLVAGRQAEQELLESHEKQRTIWQRVSVGLGFKSMTDCWE